MQLDLCIDDYLLAPGSPVRLEGRTSEENVAGKSLPADAGDLKKLGKRAVKHHKKTLVSLQERIWARGEKGVLIVLQGLDACGKDSTIRHVTSGVNPAGLRVESFKAPTPEEQRHHFLWRYSRSLPERGSIGIFNRSYYEDVVAARVHPQAAGLEHREPGDELWQERYEDINAFERHLVRENVVVIKCFLSVSRDVQRRRLIKRLRKPDKHWKFTEADLRERLYWDAHVDAAEAALAATSTRWAPWYVIPADHKWFMRALVAQVLVERMSHLELDYPEPGPDKRSAMDQALKALTGES